MRILSILLSVFAFADPILAADRPTLAGARPNIIIVMPDDMGYGDVGAHGNPLIQTPHLDRLHGQSIRFTDFHVSPTCAPTRSALMTGRHEFKNGVTHTIYERERMTLNATTLAQVLKGAGYTTGIFGKWHLGDEAAYQPDQRGFDEVYIHGAGGIGQTYAGSCGDAPDNKYFDPAVLHNGKFVKTKGYCTDLFFDQATRWIDAQRGSGKPLFVYITPNAPHGPLISPGPRYDRLYEGKSIDGKPLDKGAVAFYGMISNIDDNVGKLRNRLEEWEIERNTLLIFMTDNGGTHTRLFSAGMRGGKGTVYEGGTRVPSFWHWPAQLKSGLDIHALAGHIDMLPTLAALAGAPISGTLAEQVEGRTLVPLLQNPAREWPDRFWVTHRGRWPHGEVAKFKHRFCSIRNSRFSLVENNALYDLVADPGERIDVIDQHPEVAAKLRVAYDQWWKDIQPLLVNEDAIGPKINPFKARYWEQFGGGPDEALLKKMDPTSARGND